MKFQRHTINPKTERVRLTENNRPVSYAEVIDLWRTNGEFRKLFSDSIGRAPFDAFFWETPPVTIDTINRDFEYTLTQSSDLLDATADPVSFSMHFKAKQDALTLTFPNLGGDAILVVPCPVSTNADYTHLARFIQSAPETQIDSFWKSAGDAMKRRISASPVWLSTAGLGVSWLHLRLDSRPKYYRHPPYKIVEL